MQFLKNAEKSLLSVSEGSVQPWTDCPKYGGGSRKKLNFYWSPNLALSSRANKVAQAFVPSDLIEVPTISENFSATLGSPISDFERNSKIQISKTSTDQDLVFFPHLERFKARCSSSRRKRKSYGHSIILTPGQFWKVRLGVKGRCSCITVSL